MIDTPDVDKASLRSISIMDRRRLIIDFDRTVFDSDSLYQDLSSMCKTRGIPQDCLSPKSGLVPPAHLLFNFFLMVEKNKAIKGPQLAILLEELRIFIRNKGHKYVFPDVKPFLSSAQKAGWRISILTYGDIAFQLSKFLGSGLSTLCHGFISTQDAKWRNLPTADSSPILFLDDNPKEINDVKYHIPHVIAVEVKRPGTKYSDVYSSKADMVVDHLCWPLVY